MKSPPLLLAALLLAAPAWAQLMPTYSIEEECRNEGPEGTTAYNRCGQQEMQYLDFAGEFWSATSTEEHDICTKKVSDLPMIVFGKLQPRYVALVQCLSPYTTAHADAAVADFQRILKSLSGSH